jgi:serine/threonine protein kinase
MNELPHTSDRKLTIVEELDRTRPGEAFQPRVQPMADGEVEPGSVVGGKYKLLEAIGEGGMGAVWMASQIEPVKRFVAVKLIKAGMDSKTVLARFEAERQALSMMDHPNIARVLDVGTTAAGRPFFVMELVKGTPITEFCDRRKLSPRERLELFIPVCNAIQHAHQKGVIHRDIKPSNVLVALHDDKPVPKVIDFGIAKATGVPLTEKTLSTGFEQVVGTPAYMSPEQATFNQLDIDTRSDVYSLGVLMYELLTGTTPIEQVRFKQIALLEMLRVVREEDAPPPSTRLSSTEAKADIAAVRSAEPGSLSKQFRGELDWIAMKALDKDRTRRYETANALARDVQRYLDDEVVEARPPSAGYRLKKFARKHRGQVLAGLLVFAALLIGVVGTTIGFIRAEQARSDEADQRHIAEEAARGEAAQLAVALDQRSQAENARDRTREVLDLLARLGLLAEAEGEFRKDVATQEKLVADFPNDSKNRQSLAWSHSNLGNLLAGLGRLAEAEAEYRAAMAIQEKLAAESPHVPGLRQDLGRTHTSLGNVLGDMGKGSQSEAEYAKSLAIQEKLAAEFPAVPAYRQNLASTHGNLGILYAQMRKPIEEEAEHRKALAIREKLVAEHPSVTQYRQELAASHNNLGILLRNLGKRTEAEVECRKALAIHRRLVVEFPTVPAYRQAASTSHNNLGIVLDGLDRKSEAEGEYREALAIRERLAAEFPAIPAYRSGMAQVRNNLAGLFTSLKKPMEAEAEFRRALAIFEKLVEDFPAAPSHRNDLARTHSNFGNLIYGRGDVEGAIAEYRTGLSILEKLAAEFPAATAHRAAAAAAYDLAATYAIGSGMIASKKKEFADRAMEMLNKAVKFGFADAARLVKDTDLDAIRARDDFKLLTDALRAKSKTE